MTRKQKKVLLRICLAAILLVILAFLPLKGIAKFICYLVPYLIIGYDVLIKAVKGLFRGHPFDENFLMAVATVGATALGEYTEDVYKRQSISCFPIVYVGLREVIGS